jgi:hypothetical protein
MSERKNSRSQKGSGDEKSSPQKDGGGLGKLFGDIANQTSHAPAVRPPS